MPDLVAPFWVKVPTVGSKLQSNARGMPTVGDGHLVLVLTVTLFRILESGFCNAFQKYEKGL